MSKLFVDYVKIDPRIDYRKVERNNGIHDVKRALEMLNIRYINEKKYDDLIADWEYLRYDIYLPDYNCLIEVDDPHHYYTNNNESDFYETRARDNRKSEYALVNRIHLIRIPFWLTFDDLSNHLNYVLVNINSHRSNALKWINNFLYIANRLKSLDLNNVPLNQLYKEYCEMMKQFYIKKVIDYETFKAYIIDELDLEFKTIRADFDKGKYVEIYKKRIDSLKNDDISFNDHVIISDHNELLYVYAKHHYRINYDRFMNDYLEQLNTIKMNQYLDQFNRNAKYYPRHKIESLNDVVDKKDALCVLKEIKGKSRSYHFYHVIAPQMIDYIKRHRNMIDIKVMLAYHARHYGVFKYMML